MKMICDSYCAFFCCLFCVVLLVFFPPTKRGLGTVCNSLDFDKCCIYWTAKQNCIFGSENKNNILFLAFKSETTPGANSSFLVKSSWGFDGRKSKNEISSTWHNHAQPCKICLKIWRLGLVALPHMVFNTRHFNTVSQMGLKLLHKIPLTLADL